jgi:hypothetical protein
MESLKEIHPFALAELKKRFPLNTVPLRHPFPERPIRTLGLIKFDADVFTSEKFSRVVLMRVNLPFYFSASSTFLRPRVELGLPPFDAETVIMGKRRIFMVDIQGTGKSAGCDESALFERLINIRERYPALLEKKMKIRGEIQNVFSNAACQVKIKEEKDTQALSIFSEYFDVFLEMVDKATPLSGAALDQARQSFEEYSYRVLNHDPGVKTFKMFFGKKGGMERVHDIFFDS